MKRNKYVFIFYWVIRVGLGNSYLLYITSTHSLLSVWSWRSCVGFHSLLLACRSGKNNSEGFFLRITASGYREMVLICQNISAYIIALFFPLFSFWTCPSREHVPWSPLIFLSTETNVIRTQFAIPLGGKDNFWASKSFSYTWINMTLCFWCICNRFYCVVVLCVETVVSSHLYV